jgi:hypothetical protein
MTTGIKRTIITHTCKCGKIFDIDTASALVAVTILQVSIKNHLEDSEACV